jgi:hypothetical protein
MFSSAQTRSLIAISAFEGTAGEGLGEHLGPLGRLLTCGAAAQRRLQPAGAFTSPYGSIPKSAAPADLQPARLNTTVQPGVFKTVILADLGRTDGTAAEKNGLEAKLAAFAARPEVAGAIIDVGNDSRVAALNTWADQNPACPQGKNLVAAAIKALVDQYWAQNPLEYVVIAGGDAAIPFFRHPDQALLASEKNFVPPVLDNTASQASLRLGYVLSQDRYGSKFDVSVKDDLFPIPSLAVGRLVESAAEVSGMLMPT